MHTLYSNKNAPPEFLLVHQTKDLALSLLWLRSWLWHRFDPWPQNFHMARAWQKKNPNQTNKKHIWHHFYWLCSTLLWGQVLTESTDPQLGWSAFGVLSSDVNAGSKCPWQADILP